ncbi:uncharacterized protein LOC117493412 isoform X1 [Trematomus bernacchii]|uniref:uncharacterized protein LOC117493412 isoform X1 n=1 Tax=Trematomus bernacchii TaxID=40690 RepID=UPI00146F6A24|nr:uncharacterized protein LOC117493412 isoform X1 [Trematomus bernacchii]
MYQFAIVFTLCYMYMYIGKTLGKPDEPAPKMSSLIKCLHRNISCNSTMAGYTFPFSCPAEGEVHVYQNKSKIAVSLDGPRPFDYSDEVKNMTSDSVTTRHCRDLYIQCFFTGENKYLTEICVDYKVTEEPEKQDEPDPTFPPKKRIVGLCVVVGLIVIIVVLLCWNKKQYCARKVSQFSTYLCSCLRITKREGAQVTRHPAGSGFQENIAGDLEGQQLNGDIRLCEIAATDLDGSVENDIEYDKTLESVHVPSIDREADGRSAPVSSLDHNLSCEGVQPTKNGNIHAPVVIKDPNHRAMNGSVRDDPGGINDNNGEHFVRNEETHNGCAPGCGGPEACENEGHRLLPPESADRQALQPPDMTDEARALVNKAGFESNQPRMCSTAPENGVKSTTNMGNYQY